MDRQTNGRGRQVGRRSGRSGRGKARSAGATKQQHRLRWTMDSVAGQEGTDTGPSKLLGWMLVKDQAEVDGIRKVHLKITVSAGDEDLLRRATADLLANRITPELRIELSGVVQRGIDVRLAQGDTSVPIRFPKALGVTSPSLLVALLAASPVQQALPVARLQELCDFDVPDERRPIGKARKLIRFGFEDRDYDLDHLDKLWPLPSDRHFEWGEEAVLQRIDSPTARMLAIPAQLGTRQD